MQTKNQMPSAGAAQLRKAHLFFQGRRDTFTRVFWSGLMTVVFTLISLCQFQGALASSERTGSFSSDRANEKTVLEELEYKLIFARLPAGLVTLRKLEGASPGSVEILATARTVSFYDRLFPVNNQYRTLADSNYLLPREFDKSIHQKNVNHDLTIQFDRRRCAALAADTLTWAIEDSTRDPLSLLFFLRKYPLESGSTRHLNLDSEGLTWDVSVHHDGTASVRTPAGRFETDRIVFTFEKPSSVEPRPWKTDILTNRLAGEETQVIVWFSQDARRVPVQVSFHSSPFSVQLILVKLSDTRSAPEPHE